jgi:predicted membrane protein DUF2207
MDPIAIDVAIAVVSLGLFAAAYAGALLATRPSRPPAAPATPDLSDEPPAVVNLLANRWRLNEDAAEATLLDLAARRLIELRQPANDPMHTTVHVRNAEARDLRPYEDRVLSRVRGLAVNGVIPVTALTFRDEKASKSWNKRLHREVVLDARARGLSRRRFGGGVVAGLLTVAAISASGLALATLRSELRAEDGDAGATFGAGFFSFMILAAIVGSQRGERDTAAGRSAAARWFGVRAWLRGHEEFADLPPAAVMVWDRYLPYGAALGVTHTASRVLDLGMGNRRLVWSSYGDRWRRVRVRYPMFWSRYGQTAPQLAVPALLAVIAGVLLIRYRDLPSELDLTDLSTLAVAIGVLLLARGGYRAVRALVDLATTRTITGQVLWVEVWRTKSQGEDRPRIPWLHYLAVDDGQSDRTTAWGLPQDLPGRSCQDGDTVTIRVRPWSRRVVALTVVERGRSHRIVDAPVPEEPAAPIALGGIVRQFTGQAAPSVAAGTLLTAEEVGQALGLAVRAPETLIGVMPTATFRTADRGRDVLLLQLLQGTPARWAWNMNRRGTELPGLGDGAYQAGDRAVLRVGEATVVLTLLRDGKGRHSHLPWLLHQAATRLAHATPATPAT